MTPINHEIKIAFVSLHIIDLHTPYKRLAYPAFRLVLARGAGFREWLAR